jgi:hypothetical protein
MVTTAASLQTTTTIEMVSKRLDTASITNLNNGNFRVSKVGVQSLFHTHNIMDIVDGSKLRPAAAGTKQTEWDQGNNEALTLCMSDEEMEATSGCGRTTANEIWEKLNTMYQSVSGASKQILWQKYYGIIATESKVDLQ